MARRCLLAAYLVLLHVALGVALWRPELVARARARLDADWRHPRHRVSLFLQSTVDENAPDRSVLFFGDSLVEGLCVAAVCPHAVNFGIAGDTTLGLLQRLPRYHSPSRARAVVVLIGVNDLLTGSRVGSSIENLRRIAGLLPRDVQVVWCGILPVAKSFRGGRVNQLATQVNAALEKLCETSSTLSYIDPGKVLAGEDGCLRREYDSGDGLHLSAAGYQVLVVKMRAALAAAGVEQPVENPK